MNISLFIKTFGTLLLPRILEYYLYIVFMYSNKRVILENVDNICFSKMWRKCCIIRTSLPTQLTQNYEKHAYIALDALFYYTLSSHAIPFPLFRSSQDLRSFLILYDTIEQLLMSYS